MQTQENQKNNTQMGAVKAFFWDLFKILAISLAIILPFRLLVAEPVVCAPIAGGGGEGGLLSAMGADRATGAFELQESSQARRR
jgi:hypothetical protein